MGVKHPVNEEFFDTWSERMAYVLGYFCADGHTIDTPSMRGQYLVITSTDKSILEEIRGAMTSAHVLKIRIKPGHKDAYQLRIGSKVLCEKIHAMGIPLRKSLRLRIPAIPQSYFHAFVRGYFDGDGCVFLERSPTGGTKKLHTIFTSGSRVFLEDLQSEFTSFGITADRLYRHASSNAFQLRYSTRDSLRLFLLMYPAGIEPELCLKRKYAIFREYLQLKNLSIERIPSVLETKGPVAK